MPVEDLLYPLLRHYIASPQWFKRAVGWTYSTLPAGIRYGSIYAECKRDLAKTTPVSLQQQVNRKLGYSLQWAINTVPAYRRFAPLLNQGLHPDELLLQMPLTTKLDIKNDGSRFLSQAVPPRQRMAVFTGGSTAQPMRIYIQRNVTRPKEYAFMEAFHARLGMGQRDTVLALRGRTVPGAKKNGAQLWMYEPIKRQLILSSDHLEPRFMAAYIAAIHQWRPSYIQAFPSALYSLARWLQENPNPDAMASIKGIFLYSENIYGFQMALFREVFACPVLGHYGHSEKVLMASSMPNDDRYFFWPQYGYVELIDSNGKRISQAGEVGELVGTSFDNKVMPFIRYRTGDLAVLSTEEHPSLPGYPVFERIEGRLQEFLVCKDRRLISVTTIGAAHMFQLEQFDAIQYEQFTPGHVTLKVVSQRPIPQKIEAAIQRAFLEKTQEGCAVRLARVDHIPRTGRGKQCMLVQNLDLAEYFGVDGAISPEMSL